MSEFRIKGIDYPDENLQHGLGIGSGRGRPKGSKNGQIMPGAAYMKDYKIVGHKAEGTTEQSGTQNRNLSGPINQNLERDYQRATSKQNNTQNRSQTQTRSNNAELARGVKMVRSNSNQRGVHVTQPGETVEDRTGTTTPSDKVSRGREFANELLRYAPDNMDTQRLKFMQPVWQNEPDNQKSASDSDNNQQIRSNNAELARGVKMVKSNSNRQGVHVTQPGETDNQPASDANTADNLPRQDNEIQMQPQQDAAIQTQPAGNTPASASEDIPQTQPTTIPVNLPLTPPTRPIGVPTIPTPGNSSSTQPTGAPTATQPTGAPTATQPEGTSPAPASANTENTQTAQPETPEQKSLWDGITGWFSQAGKDIGDTVVGAWNAASGAVSDAAVWVGDRLKDGGEWALASMGDVGKWVGDRAKDLNTWWNGRGDVEVLDNGRWRQGHDGGAKEAVGNALNAAGQWIGNAAGDVGRAVGNAANDAGRAVNTWWNGRGDVEVLDNGRWRQGHDGGAREAVGNALNSAGQWVGERANDLNTWWNGRDVYAQNGDGVVNKSHEAGARENIGNALNTTGRWIGNAANDVGQFVSNTAGNVGQTVGDAANRAGARVGQHAQDARNFVTGVKPGTTAAAPYYDLQTGQWVDPVAPSLGERITGAANDAWNGVADAANNAGGWINDNVVAPVANAANDAGNFVRNTANDASQWVNNNVVAPVGNAVNQAGQWVGNAANDVGQFAGNTAIATQAIQAGVPVETVSELATARANGQLSQDEYEHRLNLAMTFAPGAEQSVRDAAQNIGQSVNDWWNGADQNVLGITTGHTPGARENITNAANQAGQWLNDNVAAPVSNAVNAVGQVGNAIVNTMNKGGKILPMTLDDGTVTNVYYPSFADQIAFERGETPEYVRQYYDKSNPNREAYWPATLAYYEQLAPGSTQNLLTYMALRNKNPLNGE